MKKFSYRVKQPIDPAKIADEKIRKDWIVNKRMKTFNFYKVNELKEIDIIIESPVSFEKAQKNIRHVKIDSLTLPVISINHLIKMKKKAGRPIEKLDIYNLNKIKKLRKI